MLIDQNEPVYGDCSDGHHGDYAANCTNTPE